MASRQTISNQLFSSIMSIIHGNSKTESNNIQWLIGFSAGTDGPITLDAIWRDYLAKPQTSFGTQNISGVMISNPRRQENQASYARFRSLGVVHGVKRWLVEQNRVTLPSLAISWRSNARRNSFTPASPTTMPMLPSMIPFSRPWLKVAFKSERWRSAISLAASRWRPWTTTAPLQKRADSSLSGST